uniref:Gamma-tubulin complex component n=1 Tax=Cacopsylla melanoneura TaxID=428564 RepID=A0A8D8TUZ2_9HEMI
MKAFCEGLFQSLEPYRQDLKQVETQFLNEPNSTSIMSVLVTVDKHTPLLEFINKIIKEVEVKQIRGCQILSHLYEHTLFGFGEVKTATRRISLLCHKILIKQLKSWFFNGTLLDPHEEFFIRSIKVLAPPTGDHTQDATLMNSTMMTATGFAGSHDKSYVKEYEIKIDMLPCYIHVRLANQILFIGETILMLSCDVDSNGLKNVNNFFEEREDELRAELDYIVANEVFSVIRLEKIVDTLKFCVTKYLWTLVIHRADLYSHLKYMKDFFLIGWGELFVEFLSKTGSKLQANVTSFAAKNLNLALIQSARSLLSMDENVISKFNFTVVKNTNEKLINQLFLNYKPDWPVQLLFTPPIIENYNTLFKFLLRLKKAQLDLHKIWLRDTKMKKRSGIPITWKLRTRLMYFLDNLQYYLQVDVLESEYSALIHAVRNSVDFDQIQLAHIEFQANILSKAFIYVGEPSSTNVLSHHSQNPLSVTVHPVNHLMSSLLDMSESFCVLASSPSPRDHERDLSLLADKFDTTISDLIVLMCELRKLRSRTVQIEQLLIRLDYNKWFTRELIGKSKFHHRLLLQGLGFESQSDGILYGK